MSQLQRLVKKKGGSVEYETIVLPYTIRKNYVPDFILSLRNGKTIIIEAKGWFKPEDRTKMLAVARDNPTMDIRFIFTYDNKLGGGSQTRYSEWCEKHNFKYAIGSVPSEWFN